MRQGSTRINSYSRDRDRSVTPTHRPSGNRSPQPPPSRVMRVSSGSVSTSNLPQTNNPAPQRRNSNASPSPAFQHQNTSSASLALSSSPYRETIRKATSLLCRELARCPPGTTPRDWEEADYRLQPLVRFERVWGKSGGAGASSTAVNMNSAVGGGGEEKERKVFRSTVRDGFILCMCVRSSAVICISLTFPLRLLNKFRPGAIPRIDPREDGLTKTSNITRFMAAAQHYGLDQEDMFNRDDLSEASAESLGRVAETIIALCELARSGVRQTRSPYPSQHGGAASTPNLMRAVSPPLNIRRTSGQQHPPQVSGNTPRKASDSTTPIRPNNVAYTPRRSSDASRDAAPSPTPPPKSPLRPAILSTRTSFTSSMTDSTYAQSSLLENRTSTQFGTVRTTTTNATSISPADGIFMRSDLSLGIQAVNKRREEFDDDDEEDRLQSPTSSYHAPLTDLPPRRASFDRERALAKLAASPGPTTSLDLALMAARRSRERKSSDLGINDLSNVEEVDEGTRRGRPGGMYNTNTPNSNTTKSQDSSSNSEAPMPASSPSRTSPPKRPSLGPLRKPSVDLRPYGNSNGNVGGHSPTPVWPDDFFPAVEKRNRIHTPELDAFGSSPILIPGSPARGLKNGYPSEVDLSVTPPSVPAKQGNPLRRPRISHGHRHSVDTVTAVVGQPITPRFPSLNQDGREGSPPSSRDSSTPSPGAGGAGLISPPMIRRESITRRNSNRAVYVPKRDPSQTPTDASTPTGITFPISPREGRGVPFPRSISGEPASGVIGMSRLPAVSSDTVTQNDFGASNGLSRNPSLMRNRGRYNSELDLPSRRRSRPISMDDPGARGPRMRHESMISFGTPSDLMSRDSSMIEVVTVREEGKPDRTYVRLLPFSVKFRYIDTNALHVMLLLAHWKLAGSRSVWSGLSIFQYRYRPDGCYQAYQSSRTLRG